MTACRRWTEDEDAYIRTHYQQLSIRAIAEHLGRTAYAVQRRASVKGWRKQTGWTRDEDTYLYTHYQTQSARVIAEHLGRTMQAVQKRAVAKGYRKTTDWTDADKAFIVAHPSWSTARLAVALDRSIRSIRRMRRAVLGHRRTHRRWTAEQLAYVADHYADMPNADIARATGHTRQAVETYAKRAGLRKSAAYIETNKERSAAFLRSMPRDKAVAAAARTRAREQTRVALGLPQKTRLILKSPETPAKMNYRHRMHHYGYREFADTKDVLYYDEHTRRRPLSEARAATHNITIRPMNERKKD